MSHEQILESLIDEQQNAGKSLVKKVSTQDPSLHNGLDLFFAASGETLSAAESLLII